MKNESKLITGPKADESIQFEVKLDLDEKIRMSNPKIVTRIIVKTKNNKDFFLKTKYLVENHKFEDDSATSNKSTTKHYQFTIKKDSNTIFYLYKTQIIQMSYNPSQPIEKIDAAKFTVSDCEIKIETISTYKNNGYWFGNILETQKLWKTESFQGIKNKIRAIFYATIPSSLLCGYLLFINLAANSNRIGLFEKSILLTLGFLLSGGFWDLIKKLFQQPEQKITMIGKTTTKFISSGLFYITFGVLAYAPFQTTNTPNFWLRNFLFVVFLFTGGAAIYFIYKCITSLSAFLDACSTNNIDNW